MEITITCKSYEELVQFAGSLLKGTGPASAMPGNTPAAPAVSNTPTAPMIPGVPVTPGTPGQGAAAPAAPAVPNTPVAPVPTASASYTQDDLAKAAITLMDSGRQAELQQLLTGFGVASLPELPAARYGEFATALRAMGAPI